jgi:two-component system, sensor histidine kinase RegB
MSIKNIFGITQENIKLETLINIRWIAIIGQLFTVCLVFFYYQFEFPLYRCLLAILLSVLLNVILEYAKKLVQRLNNFWTTLSILYDLIQLSFLLYLTGGITNPFSILTIVPTTIAVTFLSKRSSFIIALVSILLLTFLTQYYYPLPGPDISLPKHYLIGLWVSLTVGIIFLGNYAHSITAEHRTRSTAFDNLEKTLARERELISLGGLAAAAAHELATPLGTITLVVEDLKKQLGNNPKFSQDVELLNSQIQRCKNILKDFSTDPNKQDTFIDNISFKNLIKEIVFSFDQPKDKTVKIDDSKIQNNLIVGRKVEIIYALRNLIDNAIKFANKTIVIEINNSNKKLEININDDGKGFRQDIFQKLGEPYIKSNLISKDKRGLGLGIFISKTLLERTGATITFKKSSLGGALINIVWDESIFFKK